MELPLATVATAWAKLHARSRGKFLFEASAARASASVKRWMRADLASGADEATEALCGNPLN